jgi:hypothetical protein
MLKGCFTNDAEGLARSAGTGRRRRSAKWLVLAWVAFWLTAGVQPCGISLAAQQQENSTVAQTLGAGDYHAPANHSHDPAPGGTQCPDLAGAGVAPSAATAAADRLDSPRPVPSVADALIKRRDGSALNPHDLLPAPPPHALLYVRNQRLLI